MSERKLYAPKIYYTIFAGERKPNFFILCACLYGADQRQCTAAHGCIPSALHLGACRALGKDERTHPLLVAIGKIPHRACLLCPEETQNTPLHGGMKRTQHSK